MQLMEITPTAANVAQYCRHRSGQGPAAQHCSSGVGDSRRRSSEGVGPAAEYSGIRGKEDLCPAQGQREARPWSISALVLHQGLRPADGAGPVRQRHSRACPQALRDLDQKINGLNKSDLILIAARPGMGKTSIALNIALNVAKKYRQDCGFFLPGNVPGAAGHAPDLPTRALWTTRSWLTGKLTGGGVEQDWPWPLSALSQTDIRVDDNPAITVAEMNAKCRRLDNLGLVRDRLSAADDLLRPAATAAGKPGAGRRRRSPAP